MALNKRRMTKGQRRRMFADLAYMIGSLNTARRDDDKQTLRLYGQCWEDSIIRCKKLLGIKEK